MYQRPGTFTLDLLAKLCLRIPYAVAQLSRVASCLVISAALSLEGHKDFFGTGMYI